MVRFATTSSLVFWAGTLSHLGAQALQLGIPVGTLTVGQNVPVVWTRDTTDPVSFSIMQRNAQTNEILGIFPVLNGAATGTVLIPFTVPGQIAVAGIVQLAADDLTAAPPSLISTATQVTVVRASSVSASSVSTTSTSSTTFEQTSTPPPKPKPSSTDDFTSTSSTPSFTISFPILPSTSESIAETLEIFTATQPFPSNSIPSALPSSEVAAAHSGGILGSKKVTVAIAVVAGVIGLLLCILLFLHIQRRRARKRSRDFADNWDRRRYSMSPSLRDWQSSSAMSSFSAGATNVETTQTQTPTNTQPLTGQYPFVDTTQSDNQSRLPPPISIPRTYVTPPSPHSGVPLTLPLSSPGSSSVDSPGSSDASSPYSPYYTSSSSHSRRLTSPYSPVTPRSPQRITKMQEVAMLEAQRKHLREGRQSRHGLAAGNEDIDRDSWAMILNEEPLPQYVSPASSVRLLQ